MTKAKRLPRLLYAIVMFILVVLFAAPVAVTAFESFHFNGALPSIGQYVELLTTNHTALYYFWNAMLYAVVVTLLCIIVSFPLGFLFAKIKLPGLDVLFFVYIVVMMLPFQATLLPGYIQLRDFGILNTYWALICPMVFSPFAVFLLRQFMKGIPQDLLDYTTLESHSVLVMLRYVVFPQVRTAVAALGILIFCETWNMVEQPLIYLSKSSELMPFSVALNSIPDNVSYAGAMIYMVPILLLFMAFKDILASSMESYRW